MVFAIACLGSMMSQNPIKSLLAALIGLSLATVGVDANSGEYRLRLIAYIYRMACSLSSWLLVYFLLVKFLLMLEGTATGQGLIRKTGRMLFNRKEKHVLALLYALHSSVSLLAFAGSRCHHRQCYHLHD